MESGLPSQLAVAEPRVLVLADAEDAGAQSNARGHLFERFVAHLLHRYGYEQPSRRRLNVTADGIELDVVARHLLTGQGSVTECKAYSSPVPANAIDAFYGKLIQARFDDERTHGFFVALPRLNGPGDEQARNIDQNDPGFTYLNAEAVVASLRDRGDIVDYPGPAALLSDPAVVITEHGTFSAALELDTDTRIPRAVHVWCATGSVPNTVISLIGSSEYATDCPVTAVGSDEHPAAPNPGQPAAVETPVIVEVVGSTSDFEYQLPASPKFFVGRKRLVKDLDEVLTGGGGSVVLNAQSGWGKSSLALMLGDRVRIARGQALVLDSRTAGGPRYITEALREAADQAQHSGLLRLPENAAWGSLPTALRSLTTAEWAADRGPLVVFFDQFENVFRDERLTREFRDLALGAKEVPGNLIVGFAWKTDLVDWTEGHPYRLRDEIRANSTVLALPPLGAPEVNTILRRLEKALDEPLTPELRRRLREYSQGLPWLLKKLSGHLLSQVRDEGIDQGRLASEALNVQSLFDSDLAELGPVEQEALRVVARYAPLPATEITERFPAAIVQSLVDRRLIVQVGERLDTYWDVFRDYLNSGRVPVEDSYIIRQSPRSVGRLLRYIATHGNPVAVSAVSADMDVSDNAVYNLSRELRLLGVAAADEPNTVHLVEAVWDSGDREEAIRRQVATALRRHKAHTTFTQVADRGPVDLMVFAKSLPAVFPAIDVSDHTWVAYARAFLRWFEYAGLVVEEAGRWVTATDGHQPDLALLAASSRRRLKTGFPHDPPGPSLKLLESIAQAEGPLRVDSRATRRAAGPLIAIRAIEELAPDTFQLLHPELIADGSVVPAELLELMRQAPGAAAGLDTLLERPDSTAMTVGLAMREAAGAGWSDSTIRGLGKHLRAWARSAGLEVLRPPAASAVRHDPSTEI